MTRTLMLAVLLAALCASGCAPVDQRALSNVQMETGHVDSGGGGGGGGM